MDNFLCKAILFLFIISIMVCTGLVIFASNLANDDFFKDIEEDFNESDW